MHSPLLMISVKSCENPAMQRLQEGSGRMPLTGQPRRLQNALVGGSYMFRYRTFASFFICALVILIAVPVMAQTQTPAQNQLPPPVDRTGSTEANKKIAAAKAEVTKAQAALTEVVTKLRTDFEAGQDFQTAQ